MKQIGMIGIMVCFSVMLWAQKSETLVETGQTVPDFQVKMFDGSTLDIRDLRGKVVLLNFWATWCPPCRQELNRVQKDLIDRFKGKDFVFLPISRQEPYEKIKAFREQTGHRFPMGMDPNRKIYALFATATIPRNFLIGPDGRILLSEVGYDEKSFRRLLEVVDSELEKIGSESKIKRSY